MDAGRAEIDAAYRRAARVLHPDRGSEEPGAFIRATQAREILLAAMVVESQPRVVRGPRPISRALLITWISLLVFAVAVSIGGSSLPIGPLDPILRFGLLAVGAIGFAVTGKRPFLIAGIIAIAATAVSTIAFTTLGGLLGMLLLAAPLYGFLVMGRSRRVTSRP